MNLEPKPEIICFKDHPDFKPNLTPLQVLQCGAFGGTYYRKIYSSVTQSLLEGMENQFPDFKDLEKNHVSSSIYRTYVNYYGVACGTSLEYWESRGWIKAQDPYGWFQWYCRFFYGRRSEDDKRQISRWKRIAGPKGRFFKNPRTDKIKQVLIHWAVWV